MYPVESSLDRFNKNSDLSFQLSEPGKRTTLIWPHQVGVISLHTSIWLAYWLFFFYFNVIRAGLPIDLYLYFSAFSYIIEPIIFYLYFTYLVPRVLEKKKTTTFILISLGIVALVPIVAIQYVYFLQNTLSDLPRELQYRQVNYFLHHIGVSFNLLVFICLASGARFAVDWFKNQRLRSMLEQQNQLSKEALLRSQINPHFLFNTLNSIYTLSYKNDQNAPAAILKLSELMRYMLQEASGEKVSLKKEIEYIRNYIELQKLRLQDPLKVNFMIDGQYEDKLITPMLLIPFVENAFKHGISLQRPEKIDFYLKIEQNVLSFRTENAIVNPQLVRESIDSRGIGYQNVFQRLSLLYPDRHQIQIDQKKNKYLVNLTIKL